MLAPISAIFFNGTTSHRDTYVCADDEFSVGLDLDISFEFRPRSMSGVLLSVYSLAGDYLVIQLVDGKVGVTRNMSLRNAISSLVSIGVAILPDKSMDRHVCNFTLLV